VAVVGAGPTGLTAAYHLICAGHECTLFESNAHLGGRLRHEFSEQELPRKVLDAEIGVITDLGASVRTNCCVGQDVSVAQLREQYDAVLLTVGVATAQQLAPLGVRTSHDRIWLAADGITTSLDGVFAAGNAARHNKLIIKSVAEGKGAAQCIDHWLRGEPATPPARPFHIRLNRLDQAEIGELCQGASDAPRAEPEGSDAGLSEEQVRREAARCLHCECSAAGNCLLRHYADMYDCDPYRFRGTRRRLERCLHGDLVSYEPGKCIDCGICIQIAEHAAEPLGLAYVGRGFDVRLSVPFDRSLDEALSQTAQACIQACPTGALATPQAQSPCAQFCHADNIHQIEPID
jgi:ferredoxin